MFFFLYFKRFLLVLLLHFIFFFFSSSFPVLFIYPLHSFIPFLCVVSIFNVPLWTSLSFSSSSLTFATLYYTIEFSLTYSFQRCHSYPCPGHSSHDTAAIYAWHTSIIHTLPGTSVFTFYTIATLLSSDSSLFHSFSLLSFVLLSWSLFTRYCSKTRLIHFSYSYVFQHLSFYLLYLFSSLLFSLSALYVILFLAFTGKHMAWFPLTCTAL